MLSGPLAPLSLDGNSDRIGTVKENVAPPSRSLADASAYFRARDLHQADRAVPMLHVMLHLVFAPVRQARCIAPSRRCAILGYTRSKIVAKSRRALGLRPNSKYPAVWAGEGNIGPTCRRDRRSPWLGQLLHLTEHRGGHPGRQEAAEAHEDRRRSQVSATMAAKHVVLIRAGANAKPFVGR